MPEKRSLQRRLQGIRPWERMMEIMSVLNNKREIPLHTSRWSVSKMLRICLHILTGQQALGLALLYKHVHDPVSHLPRETYSWIG